MSDWEDEMDKEENAPKNDDNQKDDWENEMDDAPAEEKKDDFVLANELESEDIIKQEVVKEKQNEPNANKIDYEKLYNERNKDSLEFRKEIEEAVAGIKDDDLRLKKMLELERIKQAEKFMGMEAENKEKVKKLEKDYIRLAQRSCAKINVAEKPRAFTFTYMKNCFDDLLDILPYEKVNELAKIISIVFNKKLKEEGKKKKSNKPTIKSGKDVARDNRRGVIYDDMAGDDEDYYEEEYDERFFG